MSIKDRLTVATPDENGNLHYNYANWYEVAKEQTMETLPEFIKILSEIAIGYDSYPHAMSASAIATMWAMDKAPNGGITGFQASYIMWQIIQHWMYPTNKCGLRMLDYDDMLFPQYSHKFSKVIDHETWTSLQTEAERRLSEEVDGCTHPDVIKHWRSIVNGIVPFGYTVTKL